MKTPIKIVNILACWAGIILACTATAAATERPNIVIRFADDLGITDLGCYGKEHGNSYHEPPHIDQLAQQGMLLINAYAASPFCSPTRASILTGK